METSTFYELIGYLASILIAISLTMRSILWLRVLNLVGAFFFCAYGLLIQAYPVAAVNFFIILINLYYLRELFTQKTFLKLLQVRPDSAYVRYFLDDYAQEIQRFFPGFDYNPSEEDILFLVLHNLVPAGLFIGERQDEDCLYAHLDFVIPGYRNFKTGEFIFSQNASFFLDKGIRKIISPPGTAAHSAYLRRMGFVPYQKPTGQVMYRLDIGD